MAQPADPAGEERVPNASERILLDWPVEAEQLRLLDQEGRDLTDRAQPRQEADERISFALPQEEPFFVQSEGIDTLRLDSEERLVLPDGLMIPMREPPAEVRIPSLFGAIPMPALPQPAPAWLRLTLVASPVPATWDRDRASYHTQLSFGLLPSEGQLPPDIHLAPPVAIRLGLRGLTSLEPLPLLELEQPGLAHERTLDLHFLPSTANPILKVRSRLSNVDLELQALPRLVLRPAASSLLALGLDSMDINVQRVAAHGAPLAVEVPTAISLTVDGGARAEPSMLRLEPGQSEATFGLRSAGMAPLAVTASAGGLSTSVPLEQRLPWGPLAAALVGGAAGGFARRFVKGASSKGGPLRLAEGLLVAVVAYVAAVLGVGSLGLPMAVAATEAGAFLTGALTGFIGVNVLEALSRSAQGARH
jgi:hypothetical protein